jgi:hypothetical protein
MCWRGQTGRPPRSLQTKEKAKTTLNRAAQAKHEKQKGKPPRNRTLKERKGGNRMAKNRTASARRPWLRHGRRRCPAEARTVAPNPKGRQSTSRGRNTTVNKAECRKNRSHQAKRRHSKQDRAAAAGEAEKHDAERRGD